MNNNKLIIAAAGSGKTTYLVNEALKIKDKRVLITTYTQANEEEIRKKIIEKNQCIPDNITVQTWFSFLLKHGVRPFQSVLFEKKIKGLLLVNELSGVKYKFKKDGKEIPVCYKEDTELEKHFFSNETKIYSDKLSKFVIKCNNLVQNSVIERISKIYSHIFIDEVQDLAGYDLELLKLFFNCTSDIVLVGDPRQVVYLTHNEKKYSKYAYGKIQEFIEQECKKGCYQFEVLDKSYRCNKTICNFSDKLYPNQPKTFSENIITTAHDGIYLVKNQDVNLYLVCYHPMQLRDSKKTEVNPNYSVKNFGESKGLTFDRVLIYPTAKFISWLKDNNFKLADTSRSNFYVAITRARHSVGIVIEDKHAKELGNLGYSIFT